MLRHGWSPSLRPAGPVGVFTVTDGPAREGVTGCGKLLSRAGTTALGPVGKAPVVARRAARARVWCVRSQGAGRAPSSGATRAFGNAASVRARRRGAGGRFDDDALVRAGSASAMNSPTRSAGLAAAVSARHLRRDRTCRTGPRASAASATPRSGRSRAGAGPRPLHTSANHSASRSSRSSGSSSSSNHSPRASASPVGRRPRRRPGRRRVRLRGRRREERVTPARLPRVRRLPGGLRRVGLGGVADGHVGTARILVHAVGRNVTA